MHQNYLNYYFSIYPIVYFLYLLPLFFLRSLFLAWTDRTETEIRTEYLTVEVFS